MKNSKLHTTEDKSNEKVTSSNSKSEDTPDLARTSPSEPPQDTTIQDVVNGTPKGQEAVRKAMSKPTSVDIKETVKRFCRTDKASDNLVDIINRLILEKRIEDLKHIFRQYSQITDPDYIHIVKHSKIDRRIKKLTKELGDSNE